MRIVGMLFSTVTAVLFSCSAVLPAAQAASSSSADPLALAHVPLDRMRACFGVGHEVFFSHALMLDSSLNATIEAEGKSIGHTQKFILQSDVFVRSPTFAGTHQEEFVFLAYQTTRKAYALLSAFYYVDPSNPRGTPPPFVILADHPIGVDDGARILFQSIPGHPSSWWCEF